MSDGWFDSNEVEPGEAFDLIPNGWYEMVILESERKDTKAKDGWYLKLKLNFLQEPYQKRFLWDNLNLNNPNPQTVQIARGTLSAICRATGVMILKDPSGSELHNIPMMVKVGTKTREDNGEPQNVIKGYKAKDGAAPVLSQVNQSSKVSSTTEAQKTTAPAGKPAWGR